MKIARQQWLDQRPLWLCVVIMCGGMWLAMVTGMYIAYWLTNMNDLHGPAADLHGVAPVVGLGLGVLVTSPVVAWKQQRRRERLNSRSL